jgi:hypothetical protein
MREVKDIVEQGATKYFVSYSQNILVDVPLLPLSNETNLPSVGHIGSDL